MTIAERLTRCSEDERAVVERVVQGIERGRSVYGPMNLATDKRDLIAEADDEARDWLIYRAMLAVQRRGGTR
jgi:hypothetical protein